MDSLIALQYCRLYIDEDSKAINRNLGYIFLDGNYIMASNGPSMIKCKVKGIQKSRCIPVAKYLKGEEAQKPLFNFFNRQQDTRDTACVLYHHPYAITGTKLRFNQWNAFFKLIRKMVKNNIGLNVFQLKTNATGLVAYAVTNHYYSNAMCCRLVRRDSCIYTMSEAKTFWYNVDNWITACKVLGDFNPQTFDMTIEENGAVNFYTENDEIHIKFTPVKTDICEQNNPSTVLFSEEMTYESTL